VALERLIDLARPPARPNLYVVDWRFFAALWAAGFVVVIVVYSLLSQPGITAAGVVLLIPFGVAAVIAMGYCAMRLRVGGSVWSMALQAQGYPVGDPDSPLRPADEEERAAWRRLRRKEIGRIDYELIMARRHFVHGDLTSEQYHEIVRQLDESRPSAGTPAPRSS
jgi:hypothetical protein